MNELRSIIQQKLEEIQDIEVSAELPDDVIEENKTYFSYTLNRYYDGSDTDANYVYRVTLDGFIKRKNNAEENTLEIMDNAQNKIEEKLKDLNIRTSFQDVSVLDNIRKTKVSGEVRYYELNKGLI